MTDDETEPAPARSAGLVDRLLPPADQTGEDAQPKPSRMTPREQLVAAGLGVANVAIVAATATSMEQDQALVLLLGLLASAVTLVGARVGNRLLGIAGLFATTLVRPSSAAIFLAVVLPFYAAAMWMFLKYNRLVKAQAIVRRQQRADGGGAAPARTREARTRDKSAGAKPASKRPTASKRYTPPKPVRKRPPPSKPPRDRSPVD